MKILLPSLTSLALVAAEPTPQVKLPPTYSPPQGLDWTLEPKPYKAPWKAVGLSLLYPGLGHFYLEDYKTAVSLSTSASLLRGINQVDENDTFFYLGLIQNLIGYSAYATYRDARIYNDQLGNCYKIPTDSLASLALAPLQWSVINKPKVWGGLLGMLGAVVAITALTSDGDPQCHAASMSTRDAIFPLFALPVAIGEEAFFRGFLQASLYESLTPVGSIIVSSLAFGAAHIPNAYLLDKHDRKRYLQTALPMLTCFGAYMGYLAYDSQSLQQSTALHAWYDFILFSGAAAAGATLSVGKPTFAISIGF